MNINKYILNIINLKYISFINYFCFINLYIYNLSMNIDNILFDLEVIKQINENDKLCVCLMPGKTTIMIESNSYLSSFTRYYNNYSRNSTIEYLNELNIQITNSTQVIIDGNHRELGNTLKEGIKHALSGLENLKKTYTGDSIITSKLVLIINHLNTISISLNNFLNNNDTDITFENRKSKKSSSTRDNVL